ncbi:alpha/beta hydrolase [Flavobacterium chungangense]|uniref:Alpha/beta hydrolase n=1 Tax=Flavobacterium chungangense TaxID=554283 RepID=A0A6V6YWM9_9FLAO|nr:alpha/beta hydrolase [Flavobacterium chungangense]CAD0003092.1 alpha/beta hydrolase [Flavobacterium chungangense]
MKTFTATNFKETFYLFLFLFGIIPNLHSQIEILSLWNKIPDEINAPDYKEKEVLKEGKIQSTSLVSVTTLSVFIPKETKPDQTAVVIFPGGGYSHLSMDKEGTKVAEWLNSLGIVAFVLKYRLPSDLIMKNKSVGPLQDAQEAIRYVRSNASKWNIDPNKIGTIGFSAGGHLASTLATHFDDKVYESKFNMSARPDFSILIYPVISMENGITHKGSQTSLLGQNPSQLLIDNFSNEKKVTSQTPPTFLVHASDDGAVRPENSINYYLALKKNNISAELHIYEKGGHGFGLGVKDTSQFWSNDCKEWLKINHYIF